MKKEKEEEKARLIDHYQRCAIQRFTDNKYQETIDNCNLILKIKPTDDLALEFKLRSIIQIGDEKDFKEGEKLFFDLKKAKPHNPFIVEYDTLKRSLDTEYKLNTVDEEYKKYLDFRKQIEKMPMYKRWREDVISKCKNICQVCGSKEKLEVHHLDSFYLILKQNTIDTLEKTLKCKKLWDVDNGILLCKECHDTMESSKKRQSII